MKWRQFTRVKWCRELKRKKKKMVTERKKEVNTIAIGQYGLLRILKTLIVVRGSLTYCLFEAISVSMDKFTSRWNPSCFRKVWILLLFPKMPKEVEDFPFSQIREVTSEKNNEKVGGIKSIKKWSFEWESWRTSYKKRKVKIGEHKNIITIHRFAKFSLSVNTHYPEYGEEVIGFIWVGVLQCWLGRRTVEQQRSKKYRHIVVDVMEYSKVTILERKDWDRGCGW